MSFQPAFLEINIVWAKAHRIKPNPWNPNVMDPEMFEKERASIREFGFIDPITARAFEILEDPPGNYQIIDGEQRFKAGLAEGIEDFPIILLDVTEDEARELTIVLNDTRGQFREDRLAALVRDLASRREMSRLESLLPYSKARLDQLTERRTIDWDDLEKRRAEVNKQTDRDTDPWVERVFRMPRASADVLDEAIRKVQSEDGAEQPWQALEMIAADFLAS